MKLSKAIENRRSIRKFKSEDIDNSVIYELLESARLSPSAKNIQPWRFYIARKDNKQEVARLMKEHHKNNPENTMGMFSTALAIEEAPVLILVFRDSSSPLDRNDTLSIGSAIEHILLKATEKNLGSLWICATYNVREEISKLLKTELELYSAIAIGYPNESPSSRPRKALNEIILGMD